MKKSYLKIISVVIVMTLLLSSCGTEVVKKNSGTVSKLSLLSTTGAGNNEEETSSEESTESGAKYSVNDKLVALTFDDGPGNDSTTKILDLLEENNSVATFFTVGYNIETHGDTLKRAAEMGCEIGNHTKDHKYLSSCNDSQLKEQIDGNNESIKNATGQECKLLRAPGGKTQGVLDKINMPLIGWDIDTEDWKHKDASNQGRSDSKRSQEITTIADNVMNIVTAGDIILMHDIYNFTADLAEELIPRLIDAGFKLVTVSEMFEAYGIPLENGVVYYDAHPRTVANGTYIVLPSSGGLNIRADKTTSSDKLGEIPINTEVEVTESADGWAKVTYDGITGWVSIIFLKAKE